MEVESGARVWVNFRGRGVEGVVLEMGSEASAGGVAARESGVRLKPITRLVDGPPLDAQVLALARWIADYYLAPPGEALRLALPPGGRAVEARRVALTDDGERAVRGLGAALEPP